MPWGVGGLGLEMNCVVVVEEAYSFVTQLASDAPKAKAGGIFDQRPV